jgi:DNA-binding transcriptional ArsR family regulator
MRSRTFANPVTSTTRASFVRSARLFAALSDPTRLLLLEAIQKAGRMGASECVMRSGLSQGRTSVHLACLVSCGLLSVERAGRRRFYRIADPRIPGLLAKAGVLADDLLRGAAECSVLGKDAHPADAQPSDRPQVS